MAGAFYAAWRAIEAYGRPYDFFDMKIYHGAVVWWAGGNELTATFEGKQTVSAMLTKIQALVAAALRG